MNSPVDINPVRHRLQVPDITASGSTPSDTFAGYEDFRELIRVLAATVVDQSACFGLSWHSQADGFGWPAWAAMVADQQAQRSAHNLLPLTRPDLNSHTFGEIAGRLFIGL